MSEKKKRIAHGNIMSFFNKKCKKNDEQPSTSSLITELNVDHSLQVSQEVDPVEVKISDMSNSQDQPDQELDNDLLINVIDDKSTNDKNDFNCNKDISFYIENSVSDSEKLLAFSTLRRIKTYLRNTTGQIRLNGLSMLNIHRDITITPEEIVNEMGKTSNKRLALNL